MGSASMVVTELDQDFALSLVPDFVPVLDFVPDFDFDFDFDFATIVEAVAAAERKTTPPLPSPSDSTDSPHSPYSHSNPYYTSSPSLHRYCSS